jgi:hypothetical protein
MREAFIQDHPLRLGQARAAAGTGAQFAADVTDISRLAAGYRLPHRRLADLKAGADDGFGFSEVVVNLT